MPFFFERGSDATSNQTIASVASRPPTFRWFKLVVLILLLAALLLVALRIGNDDARGALLDCFKVAFAAMMGLLGFEASQNT